MAFGVENGGGSGTPAGRPLPYLKHALPARQENVQSLHAFLELCVQYFVHRQVIDKITNCGSVKVDALQKSKKNKEKEASFLENKRNSMSPNFGDLHTGCHARDEFGSNGVCRTRRGNSD